MSIRNASIGLSALSLATLGLFALPVAAVAQDPAPQSDTTTNDQLNKPINLDVRSGNLYYALTLLFDQIKVGNYTLPDQLKSIEVSAHFTNLPIRTALETLLKNSGFTYKADGGVYSVVPKIEERQPEPLPPDIPSREPAAKTKKVYRLSSGNLTYNVVDIVTRLGGRVLPPPIGSGYGGGALGGGGTGNAFGNGLGGGVGGFGGVGAGLGGFGGLGGGLGGFGSGAGFSGGGGLVGGGGYYGGGNNYGHTR
jgi:hypothetical protein